MEEQQIKEISKKVLASLAASQAAVGLATAKKLIEAGEAQAVREGIPAVLSVVDAGGRLVALHRMDGSLLVSLEISQKKAFSAFSLQCATSEIASEIQPGGQFYGLPHAMAGELCLFGGGIPLFDGARCIGAVGVSGGTAAQDMAIAQAMADAFSSK